LENYPEHPSNSTVEMVQKDLSNGFSFFIKIDRGIPSGCIGLKKSLKIIAMWCGWGCFREGAEVLDRNYWKLASGSKGIGYLVHPL
jgi:hypothetical protein